MNNIKELLDKYYEGDTTLEEEQMIRDHLAKHPDDSTVADKQLFTALTEVRNASGLPAKRKSISIKYLAIGSTAIAASIALLIGLRNTTPDTPVIQSQNLSAQILISPGRSGEIKDEAQALEQARRALAYVSKQLNKGTTGINQLHKLDQSISKIKNEEKL